MGGLAQLYSQNGTKGEKKGPAMMAANEAPAKPGNGLAEVSSGLWVLAAVVVALTILRGKGR